MRLTLPRASANLTSVGKDLKTPQRYSGKFQRKGSVMVVHLSDLHLNELIQLQTNQFDFIIAAQRLELYASKIKTYGEALGITRVVLAIGGDIINSDRRHDEVLNNATNRSRTVVLAVHLLRQFALDLRENFYIDVVGVCGNEGRASKSWLGAMLEPLIHMMLWCIGCFKLSLRQMVIREFVSTNSRPTSVSSISTKKLSCSCTVTKFV